MASIAASLARPDTQPCLASLDQRSHHALTILAHFAAEENTARGPRCHPRSPRPSQLVTDLDTYVVDVAAGVDAAAILAMAVIIDEDHDEEDAKRAKEEASGGGGWPFG